MKRIPLQHRGKQPRFFATEGIDELVTMVLEITTELWVVKKRLFLFEKVADEKVMSLTAEIENHELTDAEYEDLDAMRQQLIATVMRTTDGEFAPMQRLREGCASAGQNAEAA